MNKTFDSLRALVCSSSHIPEDPEPTASKPYVRQSGLSPLPSQADLSSESERSAGPTKSVGPNAATRPFSSLYSPGGTIDHPLGKPGLFRRRKKVAYTKWLEQGVTGADTSLPTFDGTSTNPNDHLMELDNDSGETIPDVRVYFWLIGHLTRDEGVQVTPAILKEWDARMVREGREYLRKARAEGNGYVRKLIAGKADQTGTSSTPIELPKSSLGIRTVLTGRRCRLLLSEPT